MTELDLSVDWLNASVSIGLERVGLIAWINFGEMKLKTCSVGRKSLFFKHYLIKRTRVCFIQSGSFLCQSVNLKYENTNYCPDCHLHYGVRCL